MRIERWRYEMRVIGWAAWDLPLLGIGVLAAAALLSFVTSAHNGQTTPDAHFESARIILFFVEALLPLISGLAAAAIVSQDPAKELMMSLPTGYSGAIVMRVLLYIAWATAIGAVTRLAIGAAGYWIAPQRDWQGVLVWFAPLLWFIGASACFALLLRNAAAGVAVLALLWVAEVFLKDVFLTTTALHPIFLILTNFTISARPEGPDPSVPYWLTNRLVLLAMAIGFLAIARWLLRMNQSLLASEA